MLFFSAVYSEWQKDICFWSLARLNTTLERSSYPPQQMMLPRQFTERKPQRLWYTHSCFSPQWLRRVTGYWFWFLDHPPVSKGLVCTPSFDLPVFFLVVQRLALQQSRRSVNLRTPSTWFRRSRDRRFNEHDERRTIPNFGDSSGRKHDMTILRTDDVRGIRGWLDFETWTDQTTKPRKCAKKPFD